MQMKTHVCLQTPKRMLFSVPAFPCGPSVCVRVCVCVCVCVRACARRVLSSTQPTGSKRARKQKGCWSGRVGGEGMNE